MTISLFSIPLANNMAPCLAKEKQDPIISPETAGVSGASEGNIKPCDRNNLNCIKLQKKINSLQEQLSNTTDPDKALDLKIEILNLKKDLEELKTQ